LRARFFLVFGRGAVSVEETILRLCEHLFDRPDRASVDVAGPVVVEGLSVGVGSVAFVLGKSVARVLSVVHLHHVVPDDLGDD
jgi:hypothetical protein